MVDVSKTMNLKKVGIGSWKIMKLMDFEIILILLPGIAKIYFLTGNLVF